MRFGSGRNWLGALISLIGIVSICVFCGRAANAAPVKPLTTATTDVVDGRKTTQGTLPWQVVLVEAGRDAMGGAFCGGTLVSSFWVLTAAHCFVDQVTCATLKGPPDFNVGFGSVDLGLQVSMVAPLRVLVAKDFDCKTFANDIALVELRAPIQGVKPIELATLQNEAMDLLVGKTFFITGWGLTLANGYNSRVLMEADVNVTSRSSCAVVNLPNWQVPASAVCAGGDGKDACKGDSGGPLFAKRASGEIQFAVVSFGDGCGEKGKSGGYTRVAPFADWIAKATRLKECTLEAAAAKLC